MLKKEEKNWLHTEYDKEKKKVELLKREGRESEWSAENTNLFEKGNGKIKQSQKNEAGMKIDIRFIAMRKIFGLYGFIFSWAAFYSALRFLMQRLYLPFYLLPPAVYTIATFFIWGTIFMLLRKKCLEQ